MSLIEEYLQSPVLQYNITGVNSGRLVAQSLADPGLKGTCGGDTRAG